MRIVLSEPFLDAYRGELERATAERHHWERVDRIDAETVAQADVVVTGHLPAEVAAAATRLKLVQTPGAGYEGIAFDALPPGVIVANTFHHGRSIAEYVVMATLALMRDLVPSDRALRAGRWRSVRYDPTIQRPDTLRGKTVGVIGLGEIGREVVRLFTVFDTRCVAIRRDPGRGSEGVTLDWLGGPDRLHDLCAESDVVVVTVPLSSETRSLIGARELAAMKPTALVVNVARGPVIDEDALYTTLVERRIAGAALDVWWRYPDSSGKGEPSSRPFAELDNVVLTPHVSGVTTETFAGRVVDIARNIDRLVAGEPLANVVYVSGSQ